MKNTFSPRKVVLFLEGNGGGAVTHAMNLAQLQDRKKFDPLLVFFEDGPSVLLAQERNLPYRLIPRNFAMDFILAWRLSRLLKRGNIDILHTHTITGNFYARWAARLLFRRPVLVTTIHSFIIDELKGATTVTWRDRFRYLREVYTRGTSKHFIAVSEKLKKRVVEDGLNPEKITVIPNGVEVLNDRDVQTYQNSVRREFNFKSGDLLIGIVGRLVPLKNHLFFLELAGSLSLQYRNLKFLIIGDGPLRESLERAASKMSLDSSVVFTGWRNDSLRMVSALDIMVLCSEIEGLNLSMLEAMGCGIPVVGSKVNGISDVISDGKTGLLAPVRDLDAFKSCLESLINKKEMRAEIGRQARELVEKEYSLRTMVARTAELYERLLNGDHERNQAHIY